MNFAPVFTASSSADRCPELPAPGVPKFSLLGSRRAASTSSRSVLKGWPGCTVMMFVTSATSITGVRSRMVS